MRKWHCALNMLLQHSFFLFIVGLDQNRFQMRWWEVLLVQHWACRLLEVFGVDGVFSSWQAILVGTVLLQNLTSLDYGNKCH